MKSRYYTLLCSLPHLPHFLKAKHPPLTPVLLEKRLAMLPEEERELGMMMLGRLPWHHLPEHDGGDDIAREYDELMARAASYPDLQELFRTLMEQRLVIAWYRSRTFGLGRFQDTEARFESGSLEPLIRQLEKGKGAWLAHRFPWLKEMKQYLETDMPYELTLLLMGVEWKAAERLVFDHPFGFEEVAAYLIRWNVLQTRFGFDAQKASSRFVTLTSEVVSEYKHTHPLFD